MKREVVDGFVDIGLRDGRIKAEMRETWTRLFESEPESALAILCKVPPNPEQASRNFWALDDNDAKFRRMMANVLKCSPEEVI